MGSPPLELFVPGRVCLFGEHSDWAGGWRRENPALSPGRALLVGTEQGIDARVSRCEGRLRLRACDEAGRRSRWYELPWEPSALRAAAMAGGFESYVAGTAYRVLQRHPDIGGLTIDNHRSTLPLRKGLSSSAAVCVLTARALGRLYDLGFDIRDEMELAYQGETTTPSRCGRLDQGCAYGRRPVAMGFDGDALTVEPLRVGASLHLVLVDLRASKDTRRILEDLNACYPSADSPVAQNVQRALGPENLRLTAAAMAAIEAGDAEGLGALEGAAQALFDRDVAPACPAELGAPVLHHLLADPRLEPWVLGGKGVGSQGDGTAQLLCRDARSQAAVSTLVEQRMGLGALRLTVPSSVSDNY